MVTYTNVENEITRWEYVDVERDTHILLLFFVFFGSVIAIVVAPMVSRCVQSTDTIVLIRSRFSTNVHTHTSARAAKRSHYYRIIHYYVSHVFNWGNIFGSFRSVAFTCRLPTLCWSVTRFRLSFIVHSLVCCVSNISALCVSRMWECVCVNIFFSLDEWTVTSVGRNNIFFPVLIKNWWMRSTGCRAAPCSQLNRMWFLIGDFVYFSRSSNSLSYIYTSRLSLPLAIKSPNQRHTNAAFNIFMWMTTIQTFHCRIRSIEIIFIQKKSIWRAWAEWDFVVYLPELFFLFLPPLFIHLFRHSVHWQKLCQTKRNESLQSTLRISS